MGINDPTAIVVACAAVVIVRDDGATEYYPWNNILAVRAREIRHAEEAVIVEERIEDMIHQMMVA